jgi:dsDNA-specific endonuclease/ATPase MutS2
MPQNIASVVSEYVSAAADAGLTEVRLVHGRGRGVQRGIVQSVLERHPQVAAFYDDTAAHLGATVAVLRKAEGS